MIRTIQRWGLLAVGAISLCAAALANQPTFVVGESMQPTLRNGSLIWLDRAYYHLHAPRRGEVVVFRRGNTTYVKRVYRGPGEQLVSLMYDTDCQGPVRENRVAEMQRLLNREKPSSRLHSVKLHAQQIPAGCVYVLGDNLLNSEDSRHFGPVPISSILGRARVPVDATYVLPYEYAPHWGMPQFKAYADGVSLPTLALAGANGDMKPVEGHLVK